MSPVTVAALAVFAVTYVLMLVFQKIRPYITVTSAIIFVILDIVSAASPESYFLQVCS